MGNLIKHEKAESFLWIYINDYVGGKFADWNADVEANVMISALFEDRA